MEGAFTPSVGVIETMRARQVRIVIGSALAVALLLALVGLTAKRHMANEIRRVIVFHLDTTRVDDFSCYGGIPQTPNIDALAAGGMRYTNSIAPLPKTSPSVASFMTGRLANRHGIYDVGGLLVDELVTMTELLRKKGFATGGFTSNPSLDELKRGPKRSAGFDQGFDEFEGITDWPEFAPGVEQPSVPRQFCKALSEAAMQFVDDHAHEKFFLWVLHLDPHATYAPPEPWDSMYLDHPELLERSVEVPKDLIHPQALVSTRKWSHEYIARHMGEVSMVDHWIGKLLAKVRNLPGRTLIVITADHGESLGDADYWFGHGANIRHPCVNVPLIIACDGEVPRGTSEALVANVDIAPTILEILGISEEPLEADGRSLVPTFGDPDPWPERLIPIQAYRGDIWRGVRSAGYSLQTGFKKDGTHLFSLLYDLRADPKESTDVADQHPDLMRLLVGFEKSWFERKSADENHLRDNPEMIERLRSLGYLD
jgi:arylsulfatase A-like enzyme